MTAITMQHDVIFSAEKTAQGTLEDLGITPLSQSEQRAIKWDFVEQSIQSRGARFLSHHPFINKVIEWTFIAFGFLSVLYVAGMAVNVIGGLVSGGPISTYLVEFVLAFCVLGLTIGGVSIYLYGICKGEMPIHWTYTQLHTGSFEWCRGGGVWEPIPKEVEGIVRRVDSAFFNAHFHVEYAEEDPFLWVTIEGKKYCLYHW